MLAVLSEIGCIILIIRKKEPSLVMASDGKKHFPNLNAEQND